MVVLRIDDFGRHGIVYIKLLHLSRSHLSAGVVATLNHEVLDDSLEDAAVVIAAVHELQEVVAMVRRVVIECHTDVAHRGFEQHLVAGGVARSLPWEKLCLICLCIRSILLCIRLSLRIYRASHQQDCAER